MKKMTTTTIVNGKTKTISVWLDERTVQALEQVNDEEFTKQYILDEHNAKLADYRETRRHRSLDADIDNGFDAPDDCCLEEEILTGVDVDLLLKDLSPEQRELFERIFIDGATQKEIAEEYGVSAVAIFYRLEKIFKKIKRNLN